MQTEEDEVTVTSAPQAAEPLTRAVAPPARRAHRRHETACAGARAMSTDPVPDAFTMWSHRQYQQLMTPINGILSTSTHVALAERTALSRNAVRSALDGSTWPQLQTVLRLAYVAGVECFTMAARDLVQHGPPLPAAEQALLAAYRRLQPKERITLLRATMQAASQPAA